MLFAPLGNSPVAPRLAVVGITPGGQVERFFTFLSVVLAIIGSALCGEKEIVLAHLAALQRNLKPVEMGMA